MPRAEGHVLQRTASRGGERYALRFFAYGERRYLTLGRQSDGWDRARAEQELTSVLSDVQRGVWEPPGDYGFRPEPDARAGEGTFGAFADEWLAARKLQISPATHRYEQWALELHLLPQFARVPLADITIRHVDTYRHHKLQQAASRRAAVASGSVERGGGGPPRRALSASSINKTIDVLQSVLEVALEYDLIARNPARGRRRRLKVPYTPPIHLDRLEHITILLSSAAQLDESPRWFSSDRRAIIATLLLAGPRSHELCDLRWDDIDLEGRRIRIRRSKTRAGHRQITILPRLHRILTSHHAGAADCSPGALVFPTRAGTPHNRSNLRSRILAQTVRHADEQLAVTQLPSFPRGLSPHSLRHTYASILVACGHDPVTVMTQLGHTDPAFTLRIYTHAMNCNDNQRQQLRDYVND